MSRTALARALSVIGHPLLLMPAAVTLSAFVRGASPPVLRQAVAVCVLLAAVVALYSAWQVHRGRWVHADASVPHERRQLNRLLTLLLLGGAAVLWWREQPAPLVAGLGVAGTLVVLAQSLRRRLKLSLHAAFAVYAGALLWPHAVATPALGLLAAGVAWSRLVLARHTPVEVACGLLAGALAGGGFQVIAG